MLLMLSLRVTLKATARVDADGCFSADANGEQKILLLPYRSHACVTPLLNINSYE